MTSSRDGEAENPTFIADGMLRRLSKWLRIMGYDVQYAGSEASDRDVVNKCRKESLVLLTRDQELYTSYEKSVLIRSVHYPEQVRQVIRKFPPKMDLFFTRCPECNGFLSAVRSSDFSNSLPPGIIDRFDEVYRCVNCGKFYWNGTHYDRIRETIDTILESAENEDNE